jgi:methyltransferase (TIGR00027 family)
MVAAYRARASAQPGAIAHDQWAAALAGAEGYEDAARYDAAHAHMETFMAVRTAFLDAEVLRALEEGVRQIVILGAGYDTRAARLAREGARFFEVDQPATQADKRARLELLDGYPIDAATYVACDFERQDFVRELAATGFDVGRPAIVIWEGVVYYLSEEAVRATLRRIAEACHPETRLFFDYVGKRFVTGDVRDPKDREARERVAAMGEPLRFGINDVLPLLYEEGFRHVRTVSFDQACLTLTGTYDRARKLRFQSIAEARVRPPR